MKIIVSESLSRSTAEEAATINDRLSDTAKKLQSFKPGIRIVLRVDPVDETSVAQWFLGTVSKVLEGFKKALVVLDTGDQTEVSLTGKSKIFAVNHRPRWTKPLAPKQLLTLLNS